MAEGQARSINWTETSFQILGRLKRIVFGCVLILSFILFSSSIAEPFNAWLRDFSRAPLWFENGFLGLPLQLAVASLLAWKLMGFDSVFLEMPVSQKAWVGAIVRAACCLALMGVVLKLFATFTVGVQFNPLQLVEKFISNIWEDFIYRGVLFAVALKYLGGRRTAVLVAAFANTLIHLELPYPYIFIAFCSSLIWGAAVARYRSLYPAWASHCLFDFCVISFFSL